MERITLTLTLSQVERGLSADIHSRFAHLHTLVSPEGEGTFAHSCEPIEEEGISGVVGEVGAEPALGFFYGDLFAGGVVGYLILGEGACAEVVGRGVGYVEAGD